MAAHKILAFFLNVYQILLAHGQLTHGVPSGNRSRFEFYSEVSYNIHRVTYTLDDIEHKILRGGKCNPHLKKIKKTLQRRHSSAGQSPSDHQLDQRDRKLLELCIPHDPRVQFVLRGTSSSNEWDPLQQQRRQEANDVTGPRRVLAHSSNPTSPVRSDASPPVTSQTPLANGFAAEERQQQFVPLISFEAATLECQLQAAAEHWINANISFNNEKRKIILCKLFRRYRDDFGRSEDHVLDFVEGFLRPSRREQMRSIRKSKKHSVDYKRIDWTSAGIAHLLA